MTDQEYEFILQDRVAKIQSINELYDLENNAHISFSGGKDSTVLHYLIDIALPNNNIPRIYANTGIEYIEMVKYVKSKAANDGRFVILNQDKNIRKTLNEYGYPFKSKLHSQKVWRGQNCLKKGKEISDLLKKYIDPEYKSIIQKCPNILTYQFKEILPFNISDKCCEKLKKALFHKYEEESNRKITITGMRADEGGAREKLTCLTHNNTKFHPLIVISDEWEEEFIKRNNIQLCKLYYPPYSFDRTGCKGCPFALSLQQNLNRIYIYICQTNISRLSAYGNLYMMNI